MALRFWKQQSYCFECHRFFDCFLFHEVWNLTKALRLRNQQCYCFECHRFFVCFLFHAHILKKMLGQTPSAPPRCKALVSRDPSSSWLLPVLVTWQARSSKQLWKLAKTLCLWKQQCSCFKFNRFCDFFFDSSHKFWKECWVKSLRLHQGAKP